MLTSSMNSSDLLLILKLPEDVIRQINEAEENINVL